MSQRRQIGVIPYVDLLTVWTYNGSKYYPEPAKASLWNGTAYAKSSSTALADLPDSFGWDPDYVENNALLFEAIL